MVYRCDCDVIKDSGTKLTLKYNSKVAIIVARAALADVLGNTKHATYILSYNEEKTSSMVVWETLVAITISLLGLKCCQCVNCMRQKVFVSFNGIFRG